LHRRRTFPAPSRVGFLFMSGRLPSRASAVRLLGIPVVTVDSISSAGLSHPALRVNQTLALKLEDVACDGVRRDVSRQYVLAKASARHG
jgi:hypothetical protein